MGQQGRVRGQDISMTRTVIHASDASRLAPDREPEPSDRERGTDVACHVRAATADDVPEMEALISHFARQNRMLFRTAPDILASIDEFLVARGSLPGDALRLVEQPHPDGDFLLGVCGLHPVGLGLAEVRGLAIHPDVAARGIGSTLVDACVERARDLRIAKVYTLTLVPRFFEKRGFIQVDRGTLHLKVWYECYRCPKFANCDETAMIRPLDLEPFPQPA